MALNTICGSSVAGFTRTSPAKLEIQISSAPSVTLIENELLPPSRLVVDRTS